MVEFAIAIDLSHLIPPSGLITREVFPALALTVRSIVDRCEQTWKEYASGAPLPNGKMIHIRSGEYLRSINQRMWGDFRGEVYSSLPYAEVIERGSPQRDMKEMLHSSLKARVSQRTGRRYLIIPFRHDTGKVMSGGKPMPDDVRQWWQGRAASFVTSIGERPVHSDIRGTILPWHEVHQLQAKRVLGVTFGQMLMTPSRTYSWGDRLRASDMRGMNLSADQVRRFQGMVNFRRPGGQGGGAHSQYLTFRTMSEGSRGWIAPAREGYWPARETARIYQPIAQDLFVKAAEADMRRMLSA